MKIILEILNKVLDSHLDFIVSFQLFCVYVSLDNPQSLTACGFFIDYVK